MLPPDVIAPVSVRVPNAVPVMAPPAVIAAPRFMVRKVAIVDWVFPLSSVTDPVALTVPRPELSRWPQL